jgi:hypothetical protein
MLSCVAPGRRKLPGTGERREFFPAIRTADLVAKASYDFIGKLVSALVTVLPRFALLVSLAVAASSCGHSAKPLPYRFLHGALEIAPLETEDPGSRPFVVERRYEDVIKEAREELVASCACREPKNPFGTSFTGQKVIVMIVAGKLEGNDSVEEKTSWTSIVVAPR